MTKELSIPFNRAPYFEESMQYLTEVVKSGRQSGDGKFTKKCSSWFQERLGVPGALLTTSCSHALEMGAHLCDVKPGDEVIMPSFTFTSTANAFVNRGATVVFIDIRPDTMNMDEKLLEEAITDKTRVIVPVHYAGVSCEMDKINEIAKKYNLFVVEDAAQGIMAKYNNKPLGTLSDFGTFSFHETKNISMGEGGALLINNPAYIEKSEILREKGTNRTKYFRGQIDKYSWVDWGSSYLPSELNAAVLLGQLDNAEKITEYRVNLWNNYNNRLKPLADKGIISLPYIPKHCTNNGHLFYFKVSDLKTRSKLLAYLKSKNIGAVFHYVPLHSSLAGKKFGRLHGEDIYTTKESERLIRLPLYYGLTENEQEIVIQEVGRFFDVTL